jgi:hypothetical protein
VRVTLPSSSGEGWGEGECILSICEKVGVRGGDAAEDLVSANSWMAKMTRNEGRKVFRNYQIVPIMYDEHILKEQIES